MTRHPSRRSTTPKAPKSKTPVAARCCAALRSALPPQARQPCSQTLDPYRLADGDPLTAGQINEFTSVTNVNYKGATVAPASTSSRATRRRATTPS